jgi:signal transduction histidine kinase
MQEAEMGAERTSAVRHAEPSESGGSASLEAEHRMLLAQCRYATQVAAYRAMHAVLSRVHASLDLTQTLDEVARGAIESTGFGVVVINLVMPGGEYKVVTVEGDEGAREQLLGQVEPAQLWEGLLAGAREHGALLYIPHTDELANDDSLHAWVPDIPESDDPERWHPMDSLYAPLDASTGERLGVLCVDVPAGGRWPSADRLELLEVFAQHAALAIEHARLHAAQRDLTRLQERERIAEDLHDLTIQRVYAAQLDIAAALTADLPPAPRSRLESAVDALDDTVLELRSSILRLTRDGGGSGLTDAVIDLVDRAANALGFRPALSVDPELGRVGDSAGADLLAVLNEALSNVIKHAHASRVEVAVELGDGWLRATVSDNGSGIQDPARISGLGNLRARAQRLHGTCSVGTNEPSGTVVVWQVPIPVVDRHDAGA